TRLGIGYSHIRNGREISGRAIRRAVGAPTSASDPTTTQLTVTIRIRESSPTRHSSADAIPTNRTDHDGNPSGCRRAKTRKNRPWAAAAYGTREMPSMFAKTLARLVMRIRIVITEAAARP